jgi:cell division protein FtsB
MDTQEHDDILEDDYRGSFTQRRFGLSTPKFLGVAAAGIAFLFYLWVIVFGDNSLLVLLNLEERQEFLTEDIERLKAQNAQLQKQYFELKEIDSDEQTTP